MRKRKFIAFHFFFLFSNTSYAAFLSEIDRDSAKTFRGLKRAHASLKLDTTASEYRVVFHPTSKSRLTAYRASIGVDKRRGNQGRRRRRRRQTR